MIAMSSFITQNSHLEGYNCALFVIGEACVTEYNNDSEEFAGKTEFYKMYRAVRSKVHPLGSQNIP